MYAYEPTGRWESPNYGRAVGYPFGDADPDAFNYYLTTTPETPWVRGRNATEATADVARIANKVLEDSPAAARTASEAFAEKWAERSPGLGASS